MGKPRLYIYASARLHIWPMPSLTNGDKATALFDTHDQRVGKVILCSFYWNILEKEIPENFMKVTDFARKNGYILMTGSDTNAHSPSGIASKIIQGERNLRSYVSRQIWCQ